MIENTPKPLASMEEVTGILLSPECEEALKTIEDEYLYWDKAKYHAPKGIDPAALWSAVKFRRMGTRISFFKHDFVFSITASMQKTLHEFDMKYSEGLKNTIGRDREYYLLSSLMEEAIASSQMEGASTTRRVAKDMLRSNRPPHGRDQQMIANNYNTVRFLSAHKADSMTPALLLEIHRLITEDTLDNSADEGRFRTGNDIAVVDDISSEVVHIPPSSEEIGPFIDELCCFINDDETFIHPVVKAIMLHFMISYLHPFVDGNGRTARSLFYWYMLKKGYWLTAYLSISRIIYRSKAQYERAFLYVENDGNDLGYFISYNLRVLEKAYDELKLYLERKQKESEALLVVQCCNGINERQARMIHMAMERPSAIFVCRELEAQLGVSSKTIRSDFNALVEKGIFDIRPINRKQNGYIRSARFKEVIRGLEKIPVGSD